MIIPIYGLKYNKFFLPRINDTIVLIKEPDNSFDKNAVAAFNGLNEKIGYVSAKSLENEKVLKRLSEDNVPVKVWGIFPNQILVELNIPENTPPNNKTRRNRSKTA